MGKSLLHDSSFTAAEKINELHQGLAKTMRLGIEAAVQIGELLTAKKAELKHGEFTPWVDTYLMFSNRTARNYMRLYANRDFVLSVRNMSGAYAILAGENGNVSVLERSKKDQGNALMNQIDKLCSLADTLHNKVITTNTALKELGTVDDPAAVFGIVSSFGHLFSSVTTLLNYYGVDFKSEVHKTEEPAFNTAKQTIDVEYEEVVPRAPDPDRKTSKALFNRIDEHTVECVDCGMQFSYDDLRENYKGGFYFTLENGKSYDIACGCRMKLTVAEGPTEPVENKTSSDVSIA